MQFAAARPTVRLSSVADLRGGDLAAWSELAATSVEPNPFFEPQALLPAAALHGDVQLGLIESGGRLIGALPLRRSLRWRRVAGPCLAVWRHRDCYLGTPLLAADAAVEAIGALIDHARGERRGMVAFEWLGAGDVVEGAVHAAARDRGLAPIDYEAFERAAASPTAPGEHLASKRSKIRVRELRRKRRQLADALGGTVHVYDRSGDPAAVEGFLRAEADGWKAHLGSHCGVSPEYAAFFRDMCARFAAAGRLQLLVLSGGGVDVAWTVNLTAGGTVFGFKTTFDEAYARYSPGAQLALELAERFGDMPFDALDSCAAPGSEMVNRLWPDRRRVASLLVPTGGALGAAAHGSARTVMAARRWRAAVRGSGRRT
jgi:CelD/BcsL family acetyltransferase involved in cellulose biosynthesis